MPLTTADYPRLSFTSGSDKKGWAGTVSLRLESYHNAVGSLRCFDATKAYLKKKVHFNWFDRDNCFTAGVRRAPPYTHLFWALFFKVAANIGDASKAIILEANSPAEMGCNRRKRRWRLVLGFVLGWRCKFRRGRPDTQELKRVGRSARVHKDSTFQTEVIATELRMTPFQQKEQKGYEDRGKNFLPYMVKAQREALKRALHSDVQPLIATAHRLATEAKLFDGLLLMS
jgi:hypothetical protein